MITPEIKINTDIILECSNLNHQIKQKVLHNVEKKDQLKIAVIPVKIVQLSLFLFQNYTKKM